MRRKRQSRRSGKGGGLKLSENLISPVTTKASAETATYGKITLTSSLDSKRYVLDVGGGDGSRARKHFPDAEITVLDKVHGWDIMERGLPDGQWDIIFCNHIIEHVIDPDFLLDECKRVMNSNTVLDIGTPNLTAWFNRALFLFGYVPHSVELSKRYGLGKAFNWNKEPLGGHIYVYTLPALKQLLKHHGFKIIERFGEASTYPAHPAIMWVDKIMTKLSPTFASALRVRCRIS